MKRFAAVLSVVYAVSALGYDEVVHQDLTQAAVAMSVLGNEVKRRQLALPKSLIDRGSRYPNSKRDLSTVAQLFLDGAQFEDDFPRTLNHFFDPRSSSALHAVRHTSRA